MQYVDRVRELTNTSGTGPFALSGPVVGFQSFAAALAIGVTCFYACEAIASNGAPRGEWEVGVGTYSAPDTLTRTTVLSSSNSNAPVDFTPGAKHVWIDVPANAFAEFLPRAEADAAYLTQAEGDALYLGQGGTASNAATLQGATWAAPLPIGATTPNSGAFSTVTASGNVTVTGAGNLSTAGGSISRISGGYSQFLDNASIRMGTPSGAGAAVRLAQSGFTDFTLATTPSVGASMFLSGASNYDVRNGANPVSWRLYNTYTDTANYERLEVNAGTTHSILARSLGTGVARALTIGTVGAAALNFQSNGVVQWFVSASSGHLGAATDNTVDIGAAGANRPRNVYAATGFVAPLGLVSAPSYSFAGVVSGFYSAGNAVFVTAAGNDAAGFSNGVAIPISATFRWSSGASAGAAPDVILNRDAAGVLGQRNGVNPQAFRVYNTIAGADSEYGGLGWTGNSLQIGTSKAGAGVARVVDFIVGGSACWRLATDGRLLPITDQTLDIGAAATNRPRTIYSVNLAPMDGTVAAPAFTFASEVGSGFYRAATNDVRLSIAGIDRVRFSTAGLVLNSANSLTWGSSGIGVADLLLTREGAGILAQRNAANAQAQRIYFTYTDGANYERIEINAGTTNGILSRSAGTGVARHLAIGTTGAASLLFWTNGATQWHIPSTGHFYPAVDNASDIGAVATRVRNVFVAGGVALKTKAGALTDADFTNPTDGMIALDVTNSRIYARIGGVWKSAVLA